MKNQSIAIIFAILISLTLQEKCGQLQSGGYTIPHRDIVIERGNSLNITCHYNKPLKGDEILTFKRQTDELTSLVRKINETSIELYIERVEKQESTFICNLKNVTDGKEQFVCMNSVLVGSAPENITDFECTNNLDMLSCSWTVKHTYVETNETVRLIFPRGQYEFNGIKERGQRRIMILDQNTNPQYRRSNSIFAIGVHMENIFGNITNNFTVENFKIVIPNPPENLTVTQLTTNSFYLQWRVPLSMRSFTPGLDHKILYTCKSDDWQLGGNKSSTHEKVIEFNLTGIPFPNSICEIAVSMKSAIANDSYWSKNASIFGITESTIPARPPAINMGSFEISNPDGKFFVYWEQLAKELQNGNEFKYEVEVEGHVKKFETTSNYHEFQNLPKENSYKINIWSKNKIGLSKEKSTLYIPPHTRRIDKPTEVIRIEHQDYLELSWNPPQRSRLTNYTIFFCDSKRDRPHQCKGNIDWINVPPNATHLNYTMTSKNYQIGIAANSLHSSSGIEWASCTKLNNGKSKMNKVHISKVEARSITIEWSWECSQPSPNEDYILSYCRIKSPSSSDCKDNMTDYVIKGPATQGKITGLVPYTTYLINVSIQPSNSTSRLQIDKPLLNTTDEAAPDGILKIFATEITNSSISIKWNSPDFPINGVLKYFLIHIDNGTTVPWAEKVDNETSYKLENLQSYSNYTIYASTCTTFCSEPSNHLVLTTLKGVPAKIKTPVSNGSNSTSISMVWERPNPPRGEIDHYEVRIKDSSGNEEVKKTHSQIYTENCEEKGNEFKVAVRAVNIFNGTSLYGEFSDELNNYCHGKGTYIFYIILVGAVVLSFPTIYFIKWIYVKLLNMSDVKVELPDGLVQKLPKAKHNEDHEQTIERASTDEGTRLLDDKKTAAPASEKSEKVAPSMERDQPSPTDQLQVSDEKNSLRQRNVPTKIADIVAGSKPTFLSSPYSMVGEHEMLKISSPYVQHGGAIMTAGRLDPAPPVTMSEMLKTKNPGYVSHDEVRLPKGYAFGAPAKNVPTTAPQVDLLTAAATPVGATSSPNYVQASDGSQMSPPSMAPSSSHLDAPAPKGVYVSVGDVAASTQPVMTSRGYVSYDTKSGKND
ncbi:unnamed protein product [Brassicogethes aeneus]|uniref:Fibronectin type-III domain-containing protein n=1 Tax=Brassicogethes aeneus TaxID=1431903 RepID=A0A9P0BGB5_BRAAE|nr:unnamed protein product [Brassicogethes aeneus]